MNNKNKTVNFDSPLMEKRIVCISNDYILTSQISSCFNSKNEYFVILEPPRSLHKYWQNEFIMLNNVLSKIKPGKILFVKVDEERISLIKKQLKINEDRYGYIDKQEQINEFVEKNSFSFNGVVRCPPDRKKVAHALLEAKRKKYRLIIDDKSEYKIKYNSNFSHLVASNSDNSVLPVLLANYCFSINADLQFFNSKTPYSPSEIYSVLGDTQGDNKRASIAKEIEFDYRSIVYSKINEISKYKFITFFTDDFQYGYFFPHIPTTHIFNRLLPSHFLASSIVNPVIEVQSAVLVDTGFFLNSETNQISKWLKNKGVITKELVEGKFTNTKLDNIIQYYPFDFLFICSHGGFPKGQRFKIKFNDKNKVKHIIVIDVFDAFDPTNKGKGDKRLINVKTFTEFVELDDRPWYNKQYKKGSSKTIVEDFLAIGRKNWNVLERKKIDMRYCNAIKTKDFSPYIPLVHSISDPLSSPFLFNNTCLSTYTLATNFIFAGSCFYIGTLKPVGNRVAINTTLDYFNMTINKKLTLATALWKAQNTNKEKVYICIGCHFQKFEFLSESENKNRLIKRIIFDLNLRKNRISNLEIEESVKARHSDAINLLNNELKNIISNI